MPAQPWGRVGLGAIVLMVFVVALAGCGGDPSNADMAAVGKTALADSQMKLSAAVELCVGKSLVDDLGIETARKVVKQSDLSKLPKAQRQAAIDSFDQCVPSSAFAATFVKQLGGGTANEALEACLTKQFDGKVGTAAAALGQPKTDPATLKLLDKCPTHDIAVQALQSGLSSGGLSADAATCVIGQLGDVTLSDVVTQSKDLQSQVEAAAKSCATAK